MARDNAVKISNGLKATDKHVSDQLADIGEKMKSLPNGQKDAKSKLGRLDSAKNTLTQAVRDLREKLATLPDRDLSSSTTHGTVKDNESTDASPHPLQPDPDIDDGAKIPVVVGRNADSGGNVTSDRKPASVQHCICS